MTQIGRLLKLTIPALLALSLSACIGQTGTADLDAVKAKNTELENAVKMLTAQVRTLNEENVAMKKIVSDMGDTVLHQTTVVDGLQASVKQLSERPVAAAPRAAPRPTSSSARSASARSTHSKPRTPAKSTSRSTKPVRRR